MADKPFVAYSLQAEVCTSRGATHALERLIGGIASNSQTVDTFGKFVFDFNY
jgi:hypothetical protein